MARDEAYHEAEKKIEAARRSAATELDLRDMKLTELPETIGQLIHLQKLDLGHDWQKKSDEKNQLTALPESLGQLTQLQSLNLYSNQLTALPESLGQLTQLQSLNLSSNQLTALPEWLGQLTRLQSLDLSDNQLTALPEWLGELTQLQNLYLYRNKLEALPYSLSNLVKLDDFVLGDNDGGNPLITLPEFIRRFTQLRRFWAMNCKLISLPEWIGELRNLKDVLFANNRISYLPLSFAQLMQLREISLHDNQLSDIPPSLAQLEHLKKLNLDKNPLNPELAEAYKQGLEAVKAYLRAKAGAQIIINEAKLILVGEGEVGKSCLLGALRGDPWEEGRPTTHGIEIKPVKVTDPDSKKEITLNGWDFGGQRVYRPTHQLFFSAPAVYLVVWKPREGPQQGFVKEWIQLIKRREPDAKILVVATHGGPQQRQPDIDRQELWDLFGKDTVLDFFFVESKPDENGERRGIDELKRAIARVASTLPEVGRSVPKSFQEAWQTLHNTGAAYLPLERVFAICREHQMDDEVARLFVTISHRLGHLIHYEHDPALRDIVVLKPDWLATAISFVLDDEETRKNHGIVSFDRLGHLWNDPQREAEHRYMPELHPLFLRLMERFDLSYKVALPAEAQDAISFWQQFKGFPNKAAKGKDERSNLHYTSLIGQLVPDNRPEKDLAREWPVIVTAGDTPQVQICRIVDAQNGQSVNAEGLFYRLIVRLHKYSLGRVNYTAGVHWQRGLVLDYDYNGRAMLEHVGNDVRITVRAPFPERFLAMLTEEVKYLVESFWKGLRCNVMVPCIEPCGVNKPGSGLYDVKSLIESKKEGFPKFPCPTCNKWQDINMLLTNAPAAAQPISLDELQIQFVAIKDKLDEVNANTRRILSQVDKSYTDLLQVLTDEAKEGPRLFSLVPVDRHNFNPKKWVRTKFRLTLWCEHSRQPLPELNENDRKKGVYEIELEREWFKKAAPYLKLMTGTLSLVLPVVASSVKLSLDDTAYKAIEEELDFSKSVIDTTIGEAGKIGEFVGASDSTNLEHGEKIRAQGATLRELHALLKARDAGFGGLVRVLNKRQEFLWVHEQFVKEY